MRLSNEKFLPTTAQLTAQKMNIKGLRVSAWAYVRPRKM